MASGQESSGGFCPQGASDEAGNIFGGHRWGGTTGHFGWRPGTLLTVLQRRTQLPQQRNVQSRMSVVTRLRNCSDTVLKMCHPLCCCDWGCTHCALMTQQTLRKGSAVFLWLCPPAVTSPHLSYCPGGGAHCRWRCEVDCLLQESSPSCSFCHMSPGPD